MTRRKTVSRQSSRRAAKLRRLVERDGLVCWICGSAIDPNLPRQDRQGGSLDHLIPRSLGGANAVENLKLAHVVCNDVRDRTPVREVA